MNSLAASSRFSLSEFIVSRPVILAPMAGITDRAFRHIAIEKGAALTYTEMVSVTGLDYHDKTTWQLVEPTDNEQHLAVQIFGADPERAARVVRKVQVQLQERLALIDINMACPARKVIKRGEGSALMAQPKLAQELMQAVVDVAVVPVTAKIRLGVSAASENYLDFALGLESAGASLIACHGRYAQQFYRDEANWNAVDLLADTLSIPVLGSGDMRNADAVYRKLNESHANGIMVARGAYGNPWIFAQVKELRAGQTVSKVDISERCSTMRHHIELQEYYRGNIVRLRKDMAWYVTGFPYAAKLRHRAMQCTSVEDFYSFVDEVEHLYHESAMHRI